jgi:hypothetical protein
MMHPSALASERLQEILEVLVDLVERGHDPVLRLLY